MSKGSGGDHFDRLAARQIAGMELPMSQTSHNHPLDRNDPADAPRCPMERLADRMNDCPRPSFLKVWADRVPDGTVAFEFTGYLDRTNRIDDLINFLARVRG
jgi:hypothetical protein